MIVHTLAYCFSEEFHFHIVGHANTFSITNALWTEAHPHCGSLNLKRQQASDLASGADADI